MLDGTIEVVVVWAAWRGANEASALLFTETAESVSFVEINCWLLSSDHCDSMTFVEAFAAN